ncbi:MAG: esterase, partial [Spirochaetae bacterium HGW-Spirochaetae-6]
APYAADLDTTICSNTTHTLTAKAFDAAGNSAVSGEVYVNIFNNSLTFNSVEEEDGYVKANADGSGAAIGTLTDLAIGRGSDGKFNRTLLSFDTSGLPDGATVTRAYLTVTYGSKSGDAWASGNSLVIDAKFGTFGGGTTEVGDWASVATADAVASIASFSSGTKQSGDFSAAGLAAINDFGMTQLKLRFVNNQTSTAYIFIKSGAGAKLTVEYEL